MFQKPDIRVLNSWVYEAMEASRDERAERWRDAEIYDGQQWTPEDWAKAQLAGIDPVTINRTFPVVNLLRGHQIINRVNIIAKGRTHDDSTISEVMTEGIKFVLDQADGQFLLSKCFQDQAVPGFGCLCVGQNPDPRGERIMPEYRPWVEMHWDPWGGPWFSPKTCRYVFHSPWKNLEDVQATFPDKAQEIKDAYGEMCGHTSTGWFRDEDQADEIEDVRMHSLSPSGWVQESRRRVRPVEMWYPVFETCTFLVLPDGNVFEITRDTDPREIYQAIQAFPPGSIEQVTAPVRKMRVTTFLGDLILQDMPTPCAHDNYPFVPFVSYTDRFGYPFGVPRQIRGQNEEINKRRSMALALLKSRRVFIEKDAIPPDGDSTTIHAEANKMDGFIVLESGGLAKFKIDENLNLLEAQVMLSRMSEGEIQEVSGANDTRLGQDARVMSGSAMDKRSQRSEIVTASIFDNFRFSLTILGRLVCQEIKANWRGPKVLRITDSVTKTDRYVKLNETVQLSDGSYAVKNNITQGTYDIVVSDAPHTDTIREQSANLLMEAVKKSPPETIPHLILAWFDISNLPNKDQIMAKLRPLFGESPDAQDLSPEEVKAEAIKRLESEQAKAQAQEQHAAAVQSLELQKLQAEIQEILARAGKAAAEAQVRPVEVGIKAAEARTKHEKCGTEAVEAGFRMGKDMQPQPAPLTPPAEVRQDKNWRQTYP